jgi:hypothetical protein
MIAHFNIYIHWLINVTTTKKKEKKTQFGSRDIHKYNVFKISLKQTKAKQECIRKQQ